MRLSGPCGNILGGKGRTQGPGAIFWALQFMNAVFSLNSVLIKIASASWEDYGLFHKRTVGFLALALAVLAGYAILWQAVLEKVDLSVAYLTKGMTVFWGLLWSAVIFGERVTSLNILGTALIFAGTVMVMGHG